MVRGTGERRLLKGNAFKFCLFVIMREGRPGNGWMWREVGDCEIVRQLWSEAVTDGKWRDRGFMRRTPAGWLEQVGEAL
jgi:hypothetical protein